MNIGIIGCGVISDAYLTHAKHFEATEITAVADLRPEAAQRQAAAHGVEALTVEELLARPEIGAVVNLTIPAAHVKVGLRALEAGKHVYSEKPIAIDLDNSRRLLERADALGLRVGCAPDTVLGAGLQTARHLVDTGAIGRPLSGTAMMLSAGPESWHANPGFFYQRGGGPMLDMGPYYLTTLVTMLGPVQSVFGSATRGYEERVCGHEQVRGQKLPVEVFTHFAGVLEFVSGAIITVTISFDVPGHRHRPIELYGTEGSLSLPDPNTFGGEVELYKREWKEWRSQPHTHAYADNARIIGLVDMLEGIEQGRPSRCSGELAQHVLEVMLAFETSSAEGRRIPIESRPARPLALPPGYRFAERAAPGSAS